MRSRVEKGDVLVWTKSDTGVIWAVILMSQANQLYPEPIFFIFTHFDWGQWWRSRWVGCLVQIIIKWLTVLLHNMLVIYYGAFSLKQAWVFPVSIHVVRDNKYILLLGRPLWPYSMLIIGWWYSRPSQQLQGHYTMPLYMLICYFIPQPSFPDRCRFWGHSLLLAYRLLSVQFLRCPLLRPLHIWPVLFPPPPRHPHPRLWSGLPAEVHNRSRRITKYWSIDVKFHVSVLVLCRIIHMIHILHADSMDGLMNTHTENYRTMSEANS